MRVSQSNRRRKNVKGPVVAEPLGKQTPDDLGTYVMDGTHTGVNLSPQNGSVMIRIPMRFRFFGRGGK